MRPVQRKVSCGKPAPASRGSGTSTRPKRGVVGARCAPFLPTSALAPVRPRSAAVTDLPVGVGAGNPEKILCVAVDEAAINCCVGTKKLVFWLLRVFRTSADPKKKVLFLITGPPTEPPN